MTREGVVGRCVISGKTDGPCAATWRNSATIGENCATPGGSCERICGQEPAQRKFGRIAKRCVMTGKSSAAIGRMPVTIGRTSATIVGSGATAGDRPTGRGLKQQLVHFTGRDSNKLPRPCCSGSHALLRHASVS